MRKNKKASIISLEVLIGVVISIIIIVSAVTIISRFYRLSDSSKDSFNQLVALIEEVNKNSHGTREIMLLRMDEDTVIIGFPKNNEKFEAMGRVKSQVGTFLIDDYFFLKPIDTSCEKDKACICLCRELDTEYEEGEIKCKDKNLICKTFEELEFSNPFLISRSLNFYETEKDEKEGLEQFKAIDVEKYGEYGENSVAVCEETEEDSCISQEYKEEKKAIYSLRYFKSFIESCKDREFIEDNKQCGCGAFDFKSKIPEEYGIELSGSGGELKLTLKKGKDNIGEPLTVNTNFCVHYIKKGENPIDYNPEKITLMSSEIPRGEMLNFIFDYSNYPIPSEVNKNSLELIELQDKLNQLKDKLNQLKENGEEPSPEDIKAYDEALKNEEEAKDNFRDSLTKYKSDYGKYKEEEYLKDYHLITFIKHDESHICLAQYNSNTDNGYINPNSEPPNKILITDQIGDPTIPGFELKEITGCKYPEEAE